MGCRDSGLGFGVWGLRVGAPKLDGRYGQREKSGCVSGKRLRLGPYPEYSRANSNPLSPFPSKAGPSRAGSSQCWGCSYPKSTNVVVQERILEGWGEGGFDDFDGQRQAIGLKVCGWFLKGEAGGCRSGDTTTCRMTRVTSHSHVRHKEIEARTSVQDDRSDFTRDCFPRGGVHYPKSMVFDGQRHAVGLRVDGVCLEGQAEQVH